MYKLNKKKLSCRKVQCFSKWIRIITLILTVWMFILQCAPPTARHPGYPARKGKEPIIKVGLVWGLESQIFSVEKSFQITNEDGSFIARKVTGKKWRAQIVRSNAGTTKYQLVAASMSTETKAKVMRAQLLKQGFETTIVPFGQIVRVGSKIIRDTRTFRLVLNQSFHSYNDAQHYKNKIWNKLETFIIQENTQNSRGVIRLTNLENGQQFESSQPILIHGTKVTLHMVQVGKEFHWAQNETRRYPETICFDLDSKGKLSVINILPLEEYLKGVIPSEMHYKFPKEALKAQAVAARSEVLAKWGLSHTSDPFDVCADVHCQVYSGLSKQTKETSKAVNETRGIVLYQNGNVCNAVYSAVCGGHGEDNQHAWGGEARDYLQGGFDGPSSLKRFGSLKNEQHVQKWIDANPPAYCNFNIRKTPEGLSYTKRYFRWQVKISQEDLKKSLRKRLGINLGNILELKPVSRGSSGRITKLKVIGTKGEEIINTELNIRKGLSESTLWSSCFYVKITRRKGNIPNTFILKGAGFGHGVGMCQTGAAQMALKGKRFDTILKHYYHKIQIQRLYR